MGNLDPATVAGFGDQWATFDQSALPEAERWAIFDAYFKLFPWNTLPKTAVGFDAGCGSGRWARCVAPRVGTLHCVDASKAALDVAGRTLKDQPNCKFHHASLDRIPLPDQSMDFGYSLGVLHHLPNTAEGMRSCVAKLKLGAPFLAYLYYAFDNRPASFRALWKITDLIRRFVSVQPYQVRYTISFCFALCVYFPLARLSLLLERVGLPVDTVPLSAYRHRSFYTMRTDAFDRFATRLERRFTAEEVRDMMRNAGLDRVEVSPSPPYWCAIGYKSEAPKAR